MIAQMGKLSRGDWYAQRVNSMQIGKSERKNAFWTASVDWRLQAKRGDV